MPLAVSDNPSRQMPLQGNLAGPGASVPTGDREERQEGQEGHGGARERVTIDLRDLAPRLKAYAAAQRRTPAAAIRLVLAQALDAGSGKVSNDATSVPASAKTTKVTLRVSAGHAAHLAQRAGASEMSQGDYVSALLDGECPPPLPASHDAAIRALMGSTDHLAVLSADLNGFLRSVGYLPNPELQRYRASVVSVVDDVRKHLAQASALIAEIRTMRRGRR